MNRIQKKCFIASTGFHLLLMVILLVGPAFLSSSSKTDNRPMIDIVPLKTIDEAMAPSGGNPNARPPEPQPQPPARRPQPQPQIAQAEPPPQPRVQQAEPPKPTPASVIRSTISLPRNCPM